MISSSPVLKKYLLHQRIPCDRSYHLQGCASGLCKPRSTWRRILHQYHQCMRLPRRSTDNRDSLNCTAGVKGSIAREPVMLLWCSSHILRSLLKRRDLSSFLLHTLSKVVRCSSLYVLHGIIHVDVIQTLFCDSRQQNSHRGHAKVIHNHIPHEVIQHCLSAWWWVVRGW